MSLVHGQPEPHAPAPVQSSRSVRASKQSIGALGEQMAARYLEMHGMRILARNWRHKFGELDLIAVDGTTLVAIEVKTRSSIAFGHPLEAITASKFGRIKALLAIWAGAHEPRLSELRVDAVGIVLGKPGEITIDHRAGIA
jgi:putative endonuclease